MSPTANTPTAPTAPRAAPIGRPRRPAAIHRAPLGWATIRAAFDAHRESRHDGRIGFVCHVCSRYTTAISRARRAHIEQG